MAFVMVKPKRRLKNADGDFLIVEFQTGECPAVRTAVSEKVVLSHKESAKDRNDNALPKWRMCWKRYNAVLLLSSEQLPVDMGFPRQHCGEAFTHRPVSFSYPELPGRAAKCSLRTGGILSLTLVQTGSLHKNFIHR
jgi:hypothetical protein